MKLSQLKDLERDQRREMILVAAQQLFSNEGIAKPGMREIAEKAGVSVGFIYRYFSGKTEIFLQLFEEHIAEILELVAIDAVRKSEQPLHKAAEVYITYLHENIMFYQMMSYFMLEGKLSAQAVERINAIIRRIIDGIELIFRDKGRTENSRMLALSYFSALNGVMISFVNYPGRSVEEIRKRILLITQTIADQFE